MEAQLDADNTAYWIKFIDHLRRELAATADPSRRVGLLHSLSRVFGDKLGKWDEAFKCLDAAVELEPDSDSLLWDSWRASARRSPEQRMAALEQLATLLDEPEDAVSCRLWLARLLRDYFEDEERAHKQIKVAAKLLPKHRGVLWALAEFAAGSGDIKEIVPQYEKLAQLTSDSVWRAALLTEIAEFKRLEGADSNEVAAPLSEALKEPEIDWTITNDILRMSAEIGDWSLHEGALMKMAEMALETESEVNPHRPPGYVFQGFDRGESKAAAFWWYISLVRERRLNQVDEALEALEKAFELLPNHPFLKIERSRLLAACGRQADALEALPDDASNIWKAELALAIGNTEMIPSLISPPSGSEYSALEKVLAEVGSKSYPAPLETAAPVDELAAWFQTHPGHADSARVAERLMESEAEIPIAQLSVIENGSPEGKWPSTPSDNMDEPWPLAVQAVLGQRESSSLERSQLFSKWAEQVSDLNLEATFVSIAARLTEREGGSLEASLNLNKRVEELAPENTLASDSIVRLLHSLGRWPELAERLSDAAAVGEDETAIRIALHERAIILEHALSDPAEAAEVVTELIAYDPGDVAAVWSTVRLAFMQGDWQLMVRALNHLSTLCSDDAPLLNLLNGEINLFAIGNLAEALSCFENATQSTDEKVAQVARIYSFYVLYQLGNLKALNHGLKKEIESASEDCKEMWLPDLFETWRVPHGKLRMSELVEHAESMTPFRLLWQLMVGMNLPDTSYVQQSLIDLAGMTPPGEIEGACRTAAALLKGIHPCDDQDFGDAYLRSQEALWYMADRLNPSDNAELLAEVYKSRAEIADIQDELEWVDWMLLRSEALEKEGKIDEALETVKEAIERSPEHPGLLGAQAYLAEMMENWAEAADTHGRLARYFASQDEKANHLSLAARILFEKLDDEQGAQNICNEALRRAPDHTRSRDMLTRVLKARGEEDKVANLIEERIEAESSTDELQSLYEEQADQMLAMDDLKGALRAVDDLLSITPERLSAYLTKIDILAEMGNWKGAIATMREYITRSNDPLEERIMTWHAAELIADQIGDADAAISWLMRLIEGGDRHPETEQRIAQIARRAEQWDVAADALGRMAEMLIDGSTEKAQVKREEAEIRLEQLFDEEGATKIAEEILATQPADLPTIKFSCQFIGKERSELTLMKALSVTQDALQSNPADLECVENLRGLAEYSGNEELVSVCDDCLKLLSGGKIDPREGDPIPAPLESDPVPSPDVDTEVLRILVAHPAETNAASRVAEIAAEIAWDSLSSSTHLPQVNRGTRIHSNADDPVMIWVAAWAKLLGYDKIVVHRAGDSPKGVIALPGGIPTVAISPSVNSPLSARHRFFLARSLWRSARGLGAFSDTNLVGPARWVVAVAAAILGERIDLPSQIDEEILDRVKKLISRKLRRSLTDPCNLLLKENRQSLRSWIEATAFSADRFALLAVSNVASTMPLVAEESSGLQGFRSLASNPEETVLKIPRCRELLRFVLSEEYLEARRKIKITELGKGGQR